VLDLVIVEGPALEAVLAGAERAGAVLVGLQDAGIIGGFDSPALYLPSRGAQERRRNALPDRRVLLDELQHATSNLDLAAERLGPFVDDVEAARQGPLLTPADLAGTSLAGGFSALVLHRADRWTALLPLHAPLKSGAPSVDVGRVGAALAAARLDNTQVLDLKAETDALYAGYLQDALRLSSCGLALIAVLLLTTLRSSRRTARVLLPLVLAVLIVAAALAACDVKLTILHLVGMLLIVAVGSNYALFFDHEAHGTSDARDAADALTLASLAIANLCTVIGFGLLAFSGVPVLEALGVTVAPGTFLALVWSGLLTSRTPATRSLADA
jgi:predicted exporter